MASHRKFLTIKEIVLFGVLGALTFALQVVMGPLPNIEPVSLLVMLFAVVFGWKCLYPIYIFVGMEILFYGFGLWNINYLYIWLILALVSIALRSMTHFIGWAILSAFFGLLFGAFCAPVDVFIGGFSYAVTKWISGISFDLMHCGGNFVIALLLFVPLRKLLTGLYQKI
ncbi:MAG: hypothetical protein E7454_02700 [Ruminococcaceae bacterium]|nr:hypothetical protein [Oscillospiraceae bacterium]